MPNAEGPVGDEEAASLFAPLNDFSALLAAVSGGPDSMALLALLARWAKSPGRPAIFAASVDHGLRAESALEAAMVAEFCTTRDIPHATLHWNGEKPKTRIMEKAREARDQLLFAHAAEVGAQGVVLAHHRDDQAETVLLRLASGSGLAGLSGMRAREETAEGVKLRPLLSLPKARLIATCHALSVPFASDPSNENDLFARPRLRKAMAALAREGLNAERLIRLAGRAGAAQEAIALQAGQARAALPPSPVGAPLTLKVETFLSLPRAVRVQLLHDLIAEHASEGHLRLERIEALSEALARDSVVQRSLAGLLFSRRDGLIVLRPAPPRRGRGA